MLASDTTKLKLRIEVWNSDDERQSAVEVSRPLA
jgi:hypothetical protein